MSNLIKLLQSNNEVSDYKINQVNTTSTELFFALGNLETIRNTKTEDTLVTVYNRHDGKIGESTFHVFKSDNNKSIEEKIRVAVSNAKLIDNQDFNLPKDEKLVKTIKSNISSYDFLDLGKKIYELSNEEIAKTHSQINALEIFINKKITSVQNSQGINKKMTSYDFFIEAIPTFDKKDGSYELYQAINCAAFDEKDLREKISLYLHNVEARANADYLKEEIKCPVVIFEKELAEFTDGLSWLLNYSMLYSQSTMYNVGMNLQEGASGDLITLSAVSQIKGSSKSRIFDEDGVNLKDKLLIENGVVKDFFGSNRFASYLNMEVTGNLPCQRLGKGTCKENELHKHPYLECLSFSGLQMDPYSDYIGGEVRLAKYFDGKEVKYLTGFSISGSLSEVFKTIRFSDQVIRDEEYEGPKFAVLQMNIL